MEDEFVLVPQAAVLLKVSRFTAWKYIRDGKLPARRIGRDWVIRRADLDAFQQPQRGRPKQTRG